MDRRRRSGSRHQRIFAPRMHRHIPLIEFLENRQLLSTFYVDNTNNSGPGSLRSAINQANANPAANGVVTIEPGIQGLGTIYPRSALPAVTRGEVTLEGLSIDGSGGAATGSGGGGTSSGTGSSLGVANGLKIQGTGDAVVDLGITGFGGSGIYVTAGSVQITGSTISGNVGTGITISANQASIAGNLIDNNANNGVDIYGSDNLIGVPVGTQGPAVTSGGNQISGNKNSGLAIFGPSASGNAIRGNLIGTDLTGTQADGNSFWGIYMDDAPFTTIGGTTPALGNVVSGNDQGGISIRGVSSQDIVVEGNEVGTDITGTQPLGNAYSGVLIGDWGVSGDAPSDVTIGGTTAGAGNVVSANGNWGVWISGAGVTGVVVQGNMIGTDVTGTYALGNSLDGVQIDSGAVANTIGGTASGEGNVISGNDEWGIVVTGSGTNQNVIARDEIGTDDAGTTPVENADGGILAFSGGAITMESNVHVSGSLAVTGGGSVSITGSSNTVTGGLYMTAGSLTVLGADASLTVNGAVTLTGGDVSVGNGGQLGLTGLTSISSADSVDITATGSTSAINLSGLTSWSTTNVQSSLSVTDGASVDDVNLTTLNGVDVSLDGTGMLAVSQWLSVTDGELDITGGDYAPTTGAATPSNSFAKLSDINGSSLYVSDDGNLDLHGIISYTGDYYYYHYENGQYDYSAPLLPGHGHHGWRVAQSAQPDDDQRIRGRVDRGRGVAQPDQSARSHVLQRERLWFCRAERDAVWHGR